MMKNKLLILTLVIFVSFTVTKRLPDLYCKKVEVLNKKPLVNQKISLSYQIFNKGTKRVTKDYDVSLFINDSLVSKDFEGAKLYPKQGIEYSKRIEKGFYHFIPKKAGKYNYKVIIDSENKIIESNEKNNSTEGFFMVFNN